MHDLKTWINLVNPHTDIRKGRFDESIFAASLGKVIIGEGAVEYKDPELFFKKTLLTKEMSSLIGNIILRLSGRKGSEPVVQLQTPFGGGKTHTLLTLYHLFKNTDIALQNNEIKTLLENSEINSVPQTNVAVIDGESINALEIRKIDDGKTIKTIWGEIAYQLGGLDAYKIIEDVDQRQIAPGSNKIGELLKKTSPNLILMDELLLYLKSSSGVKVGDGSFKGQIMSFLQQLSVAVSNHKNSLLLITLASSHKEHLDEEGEAIYQQLIKIFGRVETVKEPVDDEEIYEIIRKRLFESLGSEHERKKIVDAFWNYYLEHKEDLPGIVSESHYKKLMERSYPFHPEIIKILREKWGTIENFQRTRGVLRLLALITSDLYNSKSSSYFINLSHINLSNSQVKSELLKFVGRQYDGVIASDISGPTAKAPDIDREFGSEYARESLAEGLATSIFLHSFSGKQNIGVTESHLRLAILNPDITFSIFSEVLSRILQRLWYISSTNRDYRFTGQPNLNKILIDKEEAVTKEDIVTFVHERIWKMLDSGFEKKYRFPEKSSDIVDSQSLSLVLLGLDNTKGEQTEKLIKQLSNNHGNTHRKFKNSLIFLLPDDSSVINLEKAVRRYLALKLISDGPEAKDLSEQQNNDLHKRITNSEVSLPQMIASAFRHIAVGDEQGHFKYFDMGSFVDIQSRSVSDIIIDILKENEKLLDKIDPGLLIGEKWSLWEKGKNIINLKELWEYFPQYTNLPFLANKSVLKNSVIQGIDRGTFGFSYGDGTKFEQVKFKTAVSENEVDITELAWLLRPDFASQFTSQQIPTTQQIPTAKPEPIEPQTPHSTSSTKKFAITVDLEWSEWSNFYAEVIKPLFDENADIKIRINLEATSTEGIKEDTIELKILESLNQRNISWQRSDKTL